jgi:hypothetical protein
VSDGLAAGEVLPRLARELKFKGALAVSDDQRFGPLPARALPILGARFALPTPTGGGWLGVTGKARIGFERCHDVLRAGGANTQVV